MSSKNSLATKLASLQGVQVLVVDDDFDSGNMYTSLLKSLDATVVTVTSVKEAVETLNWLTPNILVCETGLLGDEGYILVKKLRSIEVDTGKHVPAIATTALPAKNLNLILEVGFAGYLLKPFDPEKLVIMIKQILTSMIRQLLR
ncbi:MAG: response regulator [Leptolyngbyaceae cyanobacterium RU_5_1]|nr:response regulator [Leptolyngbyaceae cyanobacterium RU_5_1]